MLIFVKKLEPGVINKIKYKHNTAAKPYSILCPYVTFTHFSYNIKLAMKKEKRVSIALQRAPMSPLSRDGWSLQGRVLIGLEFLLGLSPLS
jgi:hypothetical protein